MDDYSISKFPESAIRSGPKLHNRITRTFTVELDHVKDDTGRNFL
jgi:hypothetical protein